ncbi:HAD family hydrolase [Lentilactobacillus laojiaonis]|uniref:HAD family hydrolase n=1 Tax=Lentilactobacillus laojiaonis TaxID=2883998 RepID=UPI001D09EEC2|nr:HAD family hydrolase [Lentilactobacillus laojiaonis]UDM31891.1 HAD family hydrolase [Lentilactobacillus laojiaonis]
MDNFIFDIDGTLLNTEKMYMLPLKKVLNENGYPVSYEQCANTFGITSLDALKMLNVAESDIDIILEKWMALIPDYAKDVNLFDGILETLSILSEKKELAIASSKVREEYIRDVKRFDIDKFLSDIVLADQIKRGKPYPDMILKVIQDLNLNPENTIYVGDTIYDLQAAHNANVAFGLAGWQTKFTDKFKEADYLFNDPKEMLDL